jgi:hypothetical protein
MQCIYIVVHVSIDETKTGKKFGESHFRKRYMGVTRAGQINSTRPEPSDPRAKKGQRPGQIGLHGLTG